MQVTFKMPKVGDAADKVLVREVMVKANVEVPSPLAGTVAEVRVAVGDEGATGAPTFTIES